MSRRHNRSQQRQVLDLRPHAFIWSQMLRLSSDGSSAFVNVLERLQICVDSACGILTSMTSSDAIASHSYPETQASVSRLEMISFYWNLHIKQLTWAGISLLMALRMTSWNSETWGLRSLICPSTTTVPHLVLIYWCNLLRGDSVSSLMIVLLIWIKWRTRNRCRWSLSLSVDKRSLFLDLLSFLFCVVCCCKCCCCLHYLSNLLLSCFCVQKGRSICQRREMLQVLLLWRCVKDWNVSLFHCHPFIPSTHSILFILNSLWLTVLARNTTH